VKPRASDMLAPHWQHDDPVIEAKQLLSLAVRMYRPRKVWALCSGGNDSLCATHLATSTGLVSGVASINTTIGIALTREHANAVAARFGWPLRWLTPPVGYRELCARFGMPGPGGHNLIYQRLKERCILQLVRESKRRRRDRVMLITGCRLSESDRRMGHTEPIQREGSRLWVAPIINWSETQKLNYQLDNGIPRNPVTPILGISGECLCGAFAKPGEREKIARHFPEAEAEISACEAIAAVNGQPSRWGMRPHKNQMICQECERKNTEAA
jgi:3'-phosphoadenosine 5'-phosphosulfate sulfotransferase (PAPS reductase)/FAD synthetase